MTSTEMLIEIRRIVSTFKTRRRAALYFGVSYSFLSDVLNGKREPGIIIPEKLGYEQRVVYVKKRLVE